MEEEEEEEKEEEGKRAEGEFPFGCYGSPSMTQEEGGSQGTSPQLGMSQVHQYSTVSDDHV